MKDMERKIWKPSERWRKQRGCQTLNGDRILIGRMRRIKRSFGRRVRKGGSRTEETVKDVNGRLLRGNEERKRWAEYFEELLNVQEDREADIVAVGGVQVPVMGEENFFFYEWEHRTGTMCHFLKKEKEVIKQLYKISKKS